MFDFILSNLPWFWLGVMILCVIIEVSTMALTTCWGAVSAFLMIFISLTKIDIKWQLLIFIVLTLIFLFLTRPLVLKKIRKEKTNVNSLEGQEVLVTKRISQFEKGEAKASNGVIWTVSSFDNSEIEEGTVCVVKKVSGNTLEISAVNKK